MKISRRRLKQIIKEELSAVMEDGQLELPIHQGKKEELLQVAVRLYQDTKDYEGGGAKVVDSTGKSLNDLQDAEKPNMGKYEENEDEHDDYNELVDAFDNLHTQLYGEYVPPGEEDLQYIADALAALGAYRK